MKNGMSYPHGEGRVWTKDIDYTTKGKKCKDVGLHTKHTRKSTAGMEVVIGTEDGDRPWYWK